VPGTHVTGFVAAGVVAGCARAGLAAVPGDVRGAWALTGCGAVAAGRTGPAAGGGKVAGAGAGTLVAVATGVMERPIVVATFSSGQVLRPLQV
jgi:hypothetical protein